MRYQTFQDRASEHCQVRHLMLDVGNASAKVLHTNKIVIGLLLLNLRVL
jgi:hypothetical protein